MAWNGWSNWDTVGQIGGALGEGLEAAGKFFERTAQELMTQSATSAQRAESYHALWQQLDVLTTSAVADLNAVNPGQLDAQILARVNAMRTELAKADLFQASVYNNATAAAQLTALGKNLGAIIGAAEILHQLNGDDFSTYEYGETSLGILGGFIGAAVATIFTAGFLPVAVAGIAGAVAGKYVWENYISPEIGSAIGVRFQFIQP
jgi:hypothetical protein